jgi:endonuclease YncB( thermonuclease family)
MRRALAVVLILIFVGGAGAATADRRRRKPTAATTAPTAPTAPAAPAAAAPAGLVLGEFRLTKVVDGDTIWVDGLDSSLRLLGMDTEETFKTAQDRRLFAAGWPAYLRAKRGDAPRPVKMATPLGEDAKEFAKHFFDGAAAVRLERDDPAEVRDRYDRYLAYVLIEKDGVWLNYNVEGVRAGMSPYFSKYGYSRRYHREFVAAEAEARATQRGIWAPDAQAYPDYPERAAWWNARAAFVDQFRAASAGQASHIDLTHEDALAQLEARVGQPVVILATVGEVRPGRGRGPSKVLLSRRRSADLPLIFFDPAVLAASGLARWTGEFVTVSGTPTIYENPHTHHREVQIVVDRADQLVLSALPGLTAPTAPTAPAAPTAPTAPARPTP